MAEGIQKKIEYADLQFISAFAMGKILDFQTWEIPEIGRASCRERV